MDVSFKDLKKKCVISVADGKKLGKITDIYFSYPQNCVKGFCVESGLPPFTFEKTEVEICSVQKIGADAVFVRLDKKKQPRCGEEVVKISEDCDGDDE